MFGNEREIECDDIVMFHVNVHNRVWIGVTLKQPTVDNKSVFVRWWFPDEKRWSDKQHIPKSLLHLIGPVPDDTEWDVR